MISTELEHVVSEAKKIAKKTLGQQGCCRCPRWSCSFAKTQVRPSINCGGGDPCFGRMLPSAIDLAELKKSFKG